MDHYFDWYDISKERKVKFAQIMLLGQAKLYWHNVQRMILQRRQEPIRIWDEMKDKLREKYLPASYHEHIPQTIHNVDRYHHSMVQKIESVRPIPSGSKLSQTPTQRP